MQSLSTSEEQEKEEILEELRGGDALTKNWVFKSFFKDGKGRVTSSRVRSNTSGFLS